MEQRVAIRLSAPHLFCGDTVSREKDAFDKTKLIDYNLQNMNIRTRSFNYSLKTAILAGILASAAIVGVAFAATLNSDPKDFDTLRVNNVTLDPSSNSSVWTTSDTAGPGDKVAFAIYYHNTSSETAKNVRVRFTPENSPSASTHTFKAWVWADNASAVQGNAQVFLSQSESINFVPGTVVWRPNQTTSGSQTLPNGQTGAEIFTLNGLLIGDIAPGWSTQGNVVLGFNVNKTQVSPPPPPPTFPSVNLTADRTQITQGERATLSWSSSNASTCSASGGWLGTKNTFGSQIVFPSFSTTYTLTCSNSSGQSASDSVTVSVTSVPFPQVSLSANPSVIQQGNSSVLSWNSINADFCSSNWGGNTRSGSLTVSPNNSTTYTITCFNSRGQTSDSATVTVIQGQAPTVNLIANPTSLLQGNTAVLSWSSSNASTCSASGGWNGFKNLSGSQTVAPLNTTTYTITCSNSQGQASDSETIIVSTLQEPFPTVNLTANPSSIQQGNSSVLSWNSSNADSCFASNGWSGSKNPSGSQSVALAQTTTYTITCSNSRGQVSDSATVGVTFAPTVFAPTLIIRANPAVITQGASSVLSWNSNNTTSCIAGGGWSGGKSLNDSQSVAPTVQTNYTMTCFGPGGSVTAAALVSVINPVPQPQVLGAICGVSDSTVTVGEQVAFSSTASGGRAPYAYIWSGALSRTGVSFVTSFGTAGTKVMTIAISDADGRTASASCSTSVTPAVTPPPPPTPAPPPGEVLPAETTCEVVTVLMCTDGKTYNINGEGKVYDKNGKLIYDGGPSTDSESNTDDEDANATSTSQSASLFFNEDGRLSGLGFMLLWYFLLMLAIAFGVVVYRALRKENAPRRLDH